MNTFTRIVPWLGCAAVCALSGCSTIQKSRTACSYCDQSVVAEAPSTYENYTPPQPTLSPIPMPAPPAETAEPLPPPPETRNVPDKNVDFFESANAPRRLNLNR